jgi:hypothetical protein
MRRFFVVLLVFETIALACAAGQTASGVSCGDYPVRAGETLKVQLRLDRASDVKGSFQVTIVPPNRTSTLSGALYGYADTQIGLNQYEIPVQIPLSATGGDWTLYGVRLYIEGREPYEVPVSHCTFKIIAALKPVLPTTASVSISPSQTQLLRKEALNVQTQMEQLKSTFQQYVSSNQTGSLADLLRTSLTRSKNSLDGTQTAFQKLGSDPKQQPNADILFDDLRRGYGDAISQLSRSARGAAPQLWRVSNSPLAQEPPLLALALHPLERNARAFSTVADSGSLVFDLVVESSPQGAKITYFRKGDATPHTSSDMTRAIIRGLPYAVWIVRLEMSGFKPAVLEFDPFTEPNTVVHVDLQK